MNDFQFQPELQEVTFSRGSPCKYWLMSIQPWTKPFLSQILSAVSSKVTGEFWKWISTTKRIECFHIRFYCFEISNMNIHLIGTPSSPNSSCDPYYLSNLGSISIHLYLYACVQYVQSISLFSVAMYIFLGMTTWDWIIYQEAWSQKKTDFSLPELFFSGFDLVNLSPITCQLKFL